MRETAIRLWTQFREYLAKMPRKNKIQLLILSGIVIVLAIVAVSILNRPNYIEVYAADDYNKFLQAATVIRDMGVDYDIDPLDNIRVPVADRDRVIEELRLQGLLGTAGFDRGEYMGAAGNFGISSEQARLYADMQLGEDIRVLILQSPRIQNAQVIATRGETSPFRISNNARQASATVVLTIRGGGRLSNTEAQSIGEIVRGAIPGILYEGIQITDSELNYYRIGDNLEAETDIVSMLEFRTALTNRFIKEHKEAAEQFLEPIFRMENFTVLVTAKLDFDQKVTESVEYAPPVPGELEGMARSESRLWEAYRRGDLAEGIPGTDPNGMGTVEYPYGPFGDDGLYWKHLEEKNNEMNETRTLIEHEHGAVERLNIAVTINSRLSEDVFVGEITELLATALGIPQLNVAVRYMPFFDTSEETEQYISEKERYEELQRRERLIEMILQWSVVLLLGICFMILVRKIFVTIKPPPEPEPVLVGVGPVGIDYIADDEDDDEEEEIVYEDLELNQKSAGLEQIERFIDKDAAAVAQLLRNWISEE